MVVDIAKPSVFRLIYRYINRNLETVPAEVTVTPEDPNEDVQTGTVEFPSTGRFVIFLIHLLSFSIVYYILCYLLYIGYICGCFFFHPLSLIPSQRTMTTGCNSDDASVNRVNQAIYLPITFIFSVLSRSSLPQIYH